MKKEVDICYFCRYTLTKYERRKMSKNKHTYAEKHAVELQESSLDNLQQNEDLRKIVQFPHAFEKIFLELPYERQLAIVDLFRDLIYDNIDISPRKIKKKLSELAYDKLEKIHWMTGSFYEEGNIYYPISEDEKKLVRMECYGAINRRQDHELSACYKFFTKPQNKQKYRLKDYDLNNSPMWRVFNQFESFRRIAPKVRRYLYNNKINPDALKVMSVNDYCDVIFNAFSTSQDKLKTHFLEHGYKNLFVMQFMKQCGNEFEKYLSRKGYDNRAIHSLYRVMAQYGICDVNSVVVTETHYTKQILEDLSKNKYNVSGIKEGDPISEEVTNLLFSRGQENLILARDENGCPITARDLPTFEVHHKNAVKFANDGDYLAKVNHWDNLMLVEKEMHHIYYHAFDNVFKVDSSNECYYSRLNTATDNMCFVGGFNAETDILYENLSNNATERNREKADGTNAVNYYMMQMDRLNNIKKIANQYHIEYSKKELSMERKNLEKILQVKIKLSPEDIKMFERWLMPDKKSRGRKAAKLYNKGGNEGL